MKITTDTNVLVSGTFWKGNSFEILRKIDAKEVENVLSSDIIKEYERVINSEEILEKKAEKSLVIDEVSQRVVTNSTIVEPKEKLNIIKDDLSDNRILECAVEGMVDYIVSQDNHLLKLKEIEGIKIITPEEFLGKIKVVEE